MGSMKKVRFLTNVEEIIYHEIEEEEEEGVMKTKIERATSSIMMMMDDEQQEHQQQNMQMTRMIGEEERQRRNNRQAVQEMPQANVGSPVGSPETKVYDPWTQVPERETKQYTTNCNNNNEEKMYNPYHDMMMMMINNQNYKNGYVREGGIEEMGTRVQQVQQEWTCMRKVQQRETAGKARKKRFQANLYAKLRPVEGATTTFCIDKLLLKATQKHNEMVKHHFQQVV